MVIVRSYDSKAVKGNWMEYTCMMEESRRRLQDGTRTERLVDKLNVKQVHRKLFIGRLRYSIDPHHLPITTIGVSCL